MSSTINADTTNGVVITSDTSGEIKLQSAGTDIATVSSSGIDVTGDFTIADKIIHSGDTNTAIRFPSADTVTVETAGTERMRIDSSGNVGIGTSSPNTTAADRTVLDVNGTTSALLNISSGGTRRATFYSDSTDCIFGSITSIPLEFLASGIERMRINSSGEVYIAGTTDRGAYNLQCNGTGVWGAGAYVNGSDERIKENIVSLDSGLDVVAKLNPVTYTYKQEWSKDQSTQTGFIAQELLTALDGKNYVDGIVQQGGEYMSVAYQNIIPILTKAIQEQQDIIKALETRIQALENA